MTFTSDRDDGIEDDVTQDDHDDLNNHDLGDDGNFLAWQPPPGVTA